MSNLQLALEEKEEQIISSRDLREKYITKFEVLEKVKTLLLVPKSEFATLKQVSEFYEVDETAIRQVVTRNRDELISDGMKVVSIGDIRIILDCDEMSQSKIKGCTIINGVKFSNAKNTLFPRRAILRMGMLLRDSKVAKEVRAQLLNIEDQASDSAKIENINEEQRLLMEIGIAFTSGKVDSVIKATTEYNAFQNRHIEQLKNDNKALSKDILEWQDRNKLNAGIRKLATVTKTTFGALWNELYKNLQYKYGICLKQRGGQPYLQWVKESEWSNVIKTFCAMCEAYKQSPTEMFQQTTPIHNLNKS